MTTGPDGTFRIDQLVPGQRTLVASVAGQQPAVQVVTVTTGQTTTVSIRLAPDFPPPVIPEAPIPLLLPLLGAVALGAGTLYRRRNSISG